MSIHLKIKNQRGFTAIEILLVILVAVAIGAAVYYAIQNHKTTSKSTVSSASSSVSTTTLGKTPQALQTVVSAKLTSENCVLPNGNIAMGPGDTTGTSLADSQTFYVSNTAARVSACDSFGYYSYSNGHWSFDIGGQDILSCEQYKQYNIPPALVGTNSNGYSTPQCYDTSTNQLVTYTN